MADSRTWLVLSARKQSRRWIRVTLPAKLVRKRGLLHGGVAAADHGHLLAAEEEAVAGGAGRDAEALELLSLGRPSQGAGAGGDDQRVAVIDVAAVAPGVKGRRRRSTLAMVSLMNSVPTCSACSCICSISQGPWMASAKPG